MVTELEVGIERERYHDLQREAERERLIRQASVGHGPIRPYASLTSRIMHIAGWFGAHRRRPRPA